MLSLKGAEHSNAELSNIDIVAEKIQLGEYGADNPNFVQASASAKHLVEA